MAIPVPKLDDLEFQQLVNGAKERIPRYCRGWTDHNVSDPGVTLIELFAWMTEQMIYRLNQVPDKNFITFLNLIGMRLEAPRPAKGDIVFTLTAPPTRERRIVIPQWTEVATERTETQPAIVFTTDFEAQVLPPTLRWFLVNEDGDPRDRLRMLQDGQRLRVWSDPPQSHESFLVGFGQDLSAHTLVLKMSCHKVGIGIDTKRPPWKWEVWRGAEIGWERVAVESDTTGGLNWNGEVRLRLPYGCQPHREPPLEGATVLKCTPLAAHALPLGEQAYARSPEVYGIEAYTIGIKIPVTHSVPSGPELLGVSNGKAGQVFHLQNSDVLEPEGEDEVVEVELSSGKRETWNRVRDFGESTPEDKHYVLDPITGQVEFGPAVRQPDGKEPNFGGIPPRGSTIRMRRYRVGGGVRGNVAAERVNIRKSTLPYIASVINPDAITGGLDAQSLDDAKLKGPARLRTRYRAVTPEDFEVLSKQVPGVGRVRCLQAASLGAETEPELPPPGTVKLLVIPDLPLPLGAELDRQIELHEALSREQRLEVELQLQRELELPEGTVVRLREYLDTRRLLTTRLLIQAPIYVWVTVQVSIHASSKAEPERVRRDVKTALYQYLHPLYGGEEKKGWTFGQRLTVDKVYARIQEVPGVEYATELKLFQIDLHDRGGQRLLESSQVISVPANGVIVSYYHNVYLEP